MLAPVTIGLIQMRMSTSPRRNTATAVRMVREAARAGAQVICLPELYRTRYFPRKKNARVSRMLETIPGGSTETFSQLARELGVVLIVPVYEVEGENRYNTACVIDADGSLLGKYRKIHIPHDPGFYEQSYFDAGDLGYPIFTSRFLRFAVLICYDQWVPEAARVAALEGADVIFYPTAIGYLEGDPLPAGDWLSAWEVVQRSHAIASGVHVATANRVGREGEISFWGSSFVSDAFGRVVGQAPKDEQCVLTVAIDVEQNEEIREGWGFLRNRRPETYARITSPVGGPTPRDLGLSMPAEWESHDSTWLSWPYDRDSFAEIERVEETCLRLVQALQGGERIQLVVRDQRMSKRVARLLDGRAIDRSKVDLHVFSYADVWFRDYGPIFVVDRDRTRSAMVHWRFNAWGNKYEGLLKDGRVPEQMREQLDIAYFAPTMVLEGGAIDGNGLGTLLATEQCLLDPSRNPVLTKAEIEAYLSYYLGAEHVIWLKGGIAGDDTDGHVDTVARFVGRRTVACAFEDDPSDENYAVVRDNFERLRSALDQDGERLEVVKLPMPRAVIRTVRGRRARLPASYLNFYIGNAAAVVPTFQDENDERALQILRGVITDRPVVGIDCVDLLYGLGALHCITQQQPAVGPAH